MQPFAHQTAIFDTAKTRPYHALFCEQGTGKTKSVIDLIEHHYKHGRITAVIVITTKGLLGNWTKVELQKHSSIPYKSHVWSLDKLKNRMVGPASGNLFYFLVNVDGVLTQNFPAYFKEFLKVHPKFALVVDESTTCKNPNAARTKRVISMAKYAKIRYIMSGTPVTNSPLDLFSQSEILEPGLLGFANFYAFRARYARIVNVTFGMRTFKKITGYQNIPELRELVKSFASVVKKVDCLDLPPKVYRTIPVAMTTQQLGPYNELKAQALTYIQGNQVSVINTISLIGKLLQVCSGQMKLPDGTYLSLPNNRLEILEELVDECPGKTLIWTSFVGTAKDIGDRLGDKCIMLPSGLTLENRHKILETFRNGDVQALVANPASAGHGITLTESSNSIYYSNSFNYENRAQSEDRVHRIGQTESCLYTDLICPGTVEEKVVKILKDKKAMADSLLSNREFLKELLT